MATPRPPIISPGKKGAPLQTIWSNRELTGAQELAICSSLALGWAYNYLPAWDQIPPAGVKFLPMIFDGAHATAPNLATAAAYGNPILGFNEPYNPPPQANLTPAAAAALWPLFTATTKPLGSPSTAAGSEGWLTTFVATLGATEWDFTMLHFYSSTFANPTAVHAALDAEIANVFALWGKRVIVSEFGLIGFVGSPATWTYPTSAQWAAQLAFSGPKLNADDRVMLWTPYALTIDAAARIVNANAANLTLCNLDASLTTPGQTYAGLVNWP